jgi:glutathione S-transferase
MALDFYHGHGSPYSWRVWLALELKGIPYHLKVLSFANQDTRKPEFIAINPRHRVPTIVDDGFVLWESVPILEYLDERFGGTKLYPGDARNRARIRLLVRESEEYLDLQGIDPVTTELFGDNAKNPDMERVAQASKVVGEELAFFAKEMRGKFLAGDEPSAADLALYPWYGYVKRIAFRKPETKLTDLVPDTIKQWGARIEAWPFFDKTFPPHWK